MYEVNRTTRRCGPVLLAALLLLGAAAAQADAANDARQRVYQQERAHCLSGQSNQDQETCLREAGAALQQNMVGQSAPNAAQLGVDAVRRCDAFGGDARASCLARMDGQGSVQGSVEGGGILRELSEPVK
ncbi:MAG: hypothetical protein HXX19_01795 [Rhodoferax sp.]|nr:hypothetical protein [Rhodoferax sp.]